MRYTPNGQSVTSFSVASNRKYTTASGEQREETEWFNVSAFGKVGELCNQYLAKGRQVFVEGRLELDTWESKEGEKRSKLKVVAEDVQFLGSAPGTGEKGERRETSAAASSSADEEREKAQPAADDIPF